MPGVESTKEGENGFKVPPDLNESSSSIDRPVVLVGSGRCGSTLLQSILNTNPSFLIWGEHNGFLRHIAAAYFACAYSVLPKDDNFSVAERMDRLRDKHRWTGWDNLSGKSELRERFRCFIRGFFVEPEAGRSRWGFKEIRYSRRTNDQTLHLMFECFPETRLMVLVRAPEPTIFSTLSRWTFSRRRDGNIDVQELDCRILALADRWAAQYQRLHSFCVAHAPNCLQIRYEDLGDAETHQKLVQFLETDSFDYQSRIATMKNAANKTDPTAILIWRRIDTLRDQILSRTVKVRETYGYLGNPVEGERDSGLKPNTIPL
jgi:hypothetical protein